MLFDSDCLLKKIAEVTICCYGLIFIVSAVSKIIDFDSFPHTVDMFCALLGLDTLYGYGLPFAICIIVFELILGVGAFVHRLKKTVVWVFPCVLAFFTYITYINYADPYGGIGSCGCYGKTLELSPKMSFYKNVFLLIVSFISAISYQKQVARHKFRTKGF